MEKTSLPPSFDPSLPPSLLQETPEGGNRLACEELQEGVGVRVAAGEGGDKGREEGGGPSSRREAGGQEAAQGRTL